MDELVDQKVVTHEAYAGLDPEKVKNIMPRSPGVGGNLTDWAVGGFEGIIVSVTKSGQAQNTIVPGCRHDAAAAAR